MARLIHHKHDVTALGLTIGCVAFLVLLYSSLSHQPEVLETGDVAVPTELAIARRTSTGEVDVIRFNGAEWATIVPSDTIGVRTIGAIDYEPEVVSVVPNSDFSKLGLLVRFCTSEDVEYESCSGSGYVYDVSEESLVSIDEDNPVAPAAWLSNGSLLVEDVLEGRAKLLTPYTTTLAVIPAADSIYTMSELPDGVSSDETLVLYSAAGGEKLLRLATPDAGTAIPVPGTPSAYNTSWMTFDQSGRSIAVIRIREDEDNLLGGGRLQLLQKATSTWSRPTTITESDFMDFSPSWAAGGAMIVFLRALKTPWKSGAVTSSEDLKASVVLYDLAGTGTGTVVLTDDVIRRSLIVPGALGTAAFLEDDDGVMHTKLLDVTTTESNWAISEEGNTEHTALGAPRP